MIIALFYVAVGAVFISLLGLHRAATKPDWATFAASSPGLVLWAALALLVVVLAMAVRAYLRTPTPQRRSLSAALLVNVVTLVLTLTVAESLIRHQTVDSRHGPTFRGTLLYPMEWFGVVARHRPVLERMAHETPFFTHDPALGWVVGPNRMNATGLYASSLEGLRSPQPGLSLTDRRNRISGVAQRPAAVRIALLGDSMTFGHEVRCEESWAHRLEEALGTDVQILNFGVSGYSVSQAYLQYRQTVRAWHPDLVIMGVTSSQILRMMNVYNFLISPTGIEFPFARPRLVLGGDTWQPVNLPVPSPREIFAASSLESLPHLDQDRFYRPSEWARHDTWRFLQHSYLFRLATSLRPPAERLPERFSDDALAELTSGVLRAFVAEVRADEATPLIIHLPYDFELRRTAAGLDDLPPRGASVLRRTGVDFVSASPCLLAAKMIEGYAPEGHYAAPASEALAKCFAEVLRPQVQRRLMPAQTQAPVRKG